MQSFICSQLLTLCWHCFSSVSKLYPQPKLHSMPCTATSQPSTSPGSATCHPPTGVTSGKDGEGEVGHKVPGVSQDRNEKLGYGELKHGFFFFKYWYLEI